MSSRRWMCSIPDSSPRPWCNDHYPIQYRNGLPAHCDECGFDVNGRRWVHGEDIMHPIVAEVAPGITPSETESAQIAEALALAMRKIAQWGRVARVETGAAEAVPSGGGVGMFQQRPHSSWGTRANS